uniref:FecR family protein n=1 Tax=Pedobacter schmidteae TaxID=2201271 RepID=UPI000EB2307D|nr:FecR family protein [Pedobacter schmidteae]
MNVKLTDLYQRYIDDTCTEKERAELFSIIATNPEDPQIEGLMDGTWHQINTTEIQTFQNADVVLGNILQTGDRSLVKKNNWYRYAAAASIAVALSAAIYLFATRNPAIKQEAETASQITPGANKATLTLADGKVISLDSAADGEIARQAGIMVSKTKDGQLVYDLSKKQTGTDLAYNTISTPRGGQYQVNLPDGTKIWLNAASSLRYPTVFNEGKRKVQLTGEAYFEVAKDKTHPFIVATDKQEIEVLGTHFNVNSYTDENVTKTTLLEGSVKVSILKSQSASFLKPGQQSVLRNNGLNVYTVDTEETVAWKNGYFQFNEADLGSIMRQLSRWYNIDVVIEGKLPDDLFHFKVPRNLSLNDVLKIFETNGINFKTEGRKLIVKS